MPEALARFQDDFLAGSGEGGAGPRLKPGGSPAGFTVYRNTVVKGAVDALIANFPAVARLTGQAWMGAAAAEFAHAYPPANPALIAYGQGFPDWLSVFPPARPIPYLADVARLDRLWTECHLAADAPALPAEDLGAVSMDAMRRTAAVLHPSVRYRWFDSNVATVWRAQRREDEPGPLSWDAQPEGLLLARPRGAVIDQVMGAGLHAFLGACRLGRPLATAAAQALNAEPGCHLPAMVALMLEMGVIAALVEAG